MMTKILIKYYFLFLLPNLSRLFFLLPNTLPVDLLQAISLKIMSISANF